HHCDVCPPERTCRVSRPAALVDSDWCQQAVNVIERLAREHGRVTSEDLRREFEPPEHANQIGSAFRAACSQNIIIPIDFKISSDKYRRGRAVRVWSMHPQLKEVSA